jgi:predicted SprT family Zn-dependent metalloprotease
MTSGFWISGGALGVVFLASWARVGGMVRPSEEALLRAGELLRDLDVALDGWSKAWRVPFLYRRIRYEFDSRLTRVLGRCEPASGHIRLNEVLLDPANQALLLETLCHEAAHAVAHWQFGPGIRPHGPQWKMLMVQAGYRPRVTIPAGEIRGLAPSSYRRRLYQYVCPVCGASKTAAVRSERYRCRRCLNNGLSGKLSVSRLVGGKG